MGSKYDIIAKLSSRLQQLDQQFDKLKQKVTPKSRILTPPLPEARKSPQRLARRSPGGSYAQISSYKKPVPSHRYTTSYRATSPSYSQQMQNLTQKRKELSDITQALHSKKDQILKKTGNVQVKQKNLREKQQVLQQKKRMLEKEQAQLICRNEMNEIIQNCFQVVYNREQTDFLSRTQACGLAFSKIKKLTADIEKMKKSLEEEALKVIQRKYQLLAQQKVLEEADSRMTKQSKYIQAGKPNQIYKRREQALRQREIAYNQKIKFLQKRMGELQNKEHQVMAKSKIPTTGQPVLKSREAKLLQDQQALNKEKKKFQQKWQKMQHRIDLLKEKQEVAQQQKHQLMMKVQQFTRTQNQQQQHLRQWKQRLQTEQSKLSLKKKKTQKKCEQLEIKQDFLTKKQNKLIQKQIQLRDRIDSLTNREKELENNTSQFQSIISVVDQGKYQTIAAEVFEFADKFKHRQSIRRHQSDEVSREKQELQKKLTNILSDLAQQMKRQFFFKHVKPVSNHKSYFPEMECSDRIILPISVTKSLVLFKISPQAIKISYHSNSVLCWTHQILSEEGVIYCPNWVLAQLEIPKLKKLKGFVQIDIMLMQHPKISSIVLDLPKVIPLKQVKSALKRYSVIRKGQRLKLGVVGTIMVAVVKQIQPENEGFLGCSDVKVVLNQSWTALPKKIQRSASVMLKEKTVFRKKSMFDRAEELEKLEVNARKINIRSMKTLPVIQEKSRTTTAQIKSRFKQIRKSPLKPWSFVDHQKQEEFFDISSFYTKKVPNFNKIKIGFKK